MRTNCVLPTVCVCVGILADAPVAVAAEGSVVALIEHAAKQCALHLELPTNWTIEEAREKDACVVTAREPAHESRCGTTGDDKVLCDAERQATVTIRSGNIDDAATKASSDVYPFEFDAGKWRYTNGHMSERDAVLLRSAPHKILYADYATREHYQDGTYCCVGQNWWALVDLPAHRIAVIELSWDFIAWDEDTTSWNEATDAKAKANVERFLQALR
jgi:hypothetical protein